MRQHSGVYDAVGSVKVWAGEVESILEAPVVVGNEVYFGSADGNVYALT
jgi:outer membrane protein assembly factor BamB